MEAPDVIRICFYILLEVRQAGQGGLSSSSPHQRVAARITQEARSEYPVQTFSGLGFRGWYNTCGVNTSLERGHRLASTCDVKGGEKGEGERGEENEAIKAVETT